jgi:hypothetical protein
MQLNGETHSATGYSKQKNMRDAKTVRSRETRLGGGVEEPTHGLTDFNYSAILL